MHLQTKTEVLSQHFFKPLCVIFRDLAHYLFSAHKTTVKRNRENEEAHLEFTPGAKQHFSSTKVL